LVGASVIGVDVDTQRIKGASIRVEFDYPNVDVQLVQGGGEKLPFCNTEFDLIICNDVLEHVKSHTFTLSEIPRVLKPGVWIYIQFPNLLSLPNIFSDLHYGLFGVSLLPSRIGEWYVVSLRKKASTYQVGSFPIASRIVGLLNRLDIEIIKWEPMPKREIGIFTHFLQLYRLNTQPIITLVGRKRC
jgi:ubiquinone/menaquinone biosynthesis C-methylase UbiE